MKIEFVEISGFRGFRDKTRFDFPAGFVVLTGRNGVGKSTVLDAIDFALTGTINKFSVKNARGGGIDEHIWWKGGGQANTFYVAVGFVGDNDQRIVVTRSRDTGLDDSAPEEIAKLWGGSNQSEISPETLVQTTLIRDETLMSLSLDLPEQARFTAVRSAIGGLIGSDYSDRTNAIVRAANSSRDEQALKTRLAQQDLGRALTELTEARSEAERSSDVSAALLTLRELLPDLPSDPKTRIEFTRAQLVEKKRRLAEISEAIAQAENLSRQVLYDAGPGAQAEVSNLNQRVEVATAERDRLQELHRAAAQKERLEEENDAFATHLAALLDHGSAVGLVEGHCPLCDAARSSEQFALALTSAKERLAKRSGGLSEAIAERRNLDVSLGDAAKYLESVLAERSQRDIAQASLSSQLGHIQSVFERWAIPAQATEPAEARRLLNAQQESLVALERALLVLDASAAADRVATLESRIAVLREAVEREETALVEVERAVDIAKQIEASAKATANQMLTEQFDTVMPLLKELYGRLRPHADWREIEADFGGKIRASLNFTVGDGLNVQFLFSSGQRRAAGLAFLLAIHLSRPWCRLQTLLLDDPVQHIDDYRALNLVEVLAAIRRTGRQVIIAVEDTALAEVLCRRLRSLPSQFGRRFDIHTSVTGTGAIEHMQDIFPMPKEVLRIAAAS